MKWVKDILTEFDNNTASLVRIGAALGVLTYLGLAVAKFVITREFPMQEFGVGLGTTLGATGVAIHLGESKPEDKP